MLVRVGDPLRSPGLRLPGGDGGVKKAGAFDSSRRTFLVAYRYTSLSSSSVIVFSPTSSYRRLLLPDYRSRFSSYRFVLAEPSRLTVLCSPLLPHLLTSIIMFVCVCVRCYNLRVFVQSNVVYFCGCYVRCFIMLLFYCLLLCVCEHLLACSSSVPMLLVFGYYYMRFVPSRRSIACHHLTV